MCNLHGKQGPYSKGEIDFLANFAIITANPVRTQFMMYLLGLKKPRLVLPRDGVLIVEEV